MKPEFATNPSDWVEVEKRGIIFRDANGDPIVAFKDHYELNPNTGEMEPAHPPIQPDATTAEVVEDVSEIAREGPGKPKTIEKIDNNVGNVEKDRPNK